MPKYSLQKVRPHQVEITCLDGRVFGDLNDTITITCKEDGNWTSVDHDIFLCRKGESNY